MYDLSEKEFAWEPEALRHTFSGVKHPRNHLRAHGVVRHDVVPQQPVLRRGAKRSSGLKPLLYIYIYTWHIHIYIYVYYDKTSLQPAPGSTRSLEGDVLVQSMVEHALDPHQLRMRRLRARVFLQHTSCRDLRSCQHGFFCLLVLPVPCPTTRHMADACHECCWNTPALACVCSSAQARTAPSSSFSRACLKRRHLRAPKSASTQRQSTHSTRPETIQGAQYPTHERCLNQAGTKPAGRVAKVASHICMTPSPARTGQSQSA